MNTIATLDAPVMPMVHAEETRSALRIWPPRLKPKTKPWANRFLRALPADCMLRVEPALRLLTMLRQEILYVQHSVPEYVYFPETAVISHQRVLMDGRTVEIALTGREGSLGMSSVFGAGLTSSSAHVAQTGSALRIERQMLVKLVRVYPDLVPLFAEDIGRYINDISCRSICNTHHDMRQRLSTWLLLMQDLSGQAALTLTHEQMARSLGVYRPSITFTTSGMRVDGLIEYSRSTVVIEDRSGLENAACTCYRELAKGW